MLAIGSCSVLFEEYYQCILKYSSFQVTELQVLNNFILEKCSMVIGATIRGLGSEGAIAGLLTGLL